MQDLAAQPHGKALLVNGWLLLATVEGYLCYPLPGSRSEIRELVPLFSSQGSHLVARGDVKLA